MPERQRTTTRLKTLFQRPALFVLAGGINPIGAKMAEALGYDAFYMSGAIPRRTNWAGPTPGPVCKPQRAWRVLGESGVLSRFEALRAAALTPLVGRGRRSTCCCGVGVAPPKVKGKSC